MIDRSVHDGRSVGKETNKEIPVSCRSFSGMLCHRCIAASLPLQFPILETSATAFWGTKSYTFSSLALLMHSDVLLIYYYTIYNPYIVYIYVPLTSRGVMKRSTKVWFKRTSQTFRSPPQGPMSLLVLWVLSSLHICLSQSFHILSSFILDTWSDDYLLLTPERVLWTTRYFAYVVRCHVPCAQCFVHCASCLWTKPSALITPGKFGKLLSKSPGSCITAGVSRLNMRNLTLPTREELRPMTPN